MTENKSYLKAAKEVAKNNQYTCLVMPTGSKAKEDYKDMFGPANIRGRVRRANDWWNEACGAQNKIFHRNGTYAHNARVIALLLAHERAKTGDM